MSEAIDREHFDMLPFIAILMCTLGCLVYVTMIVASLCIGPGAGESWVPSPGPGPSGKQPVLIEWDGKVATFHRDGKRLRLPWAQRPDDPAAGDDAAADSSSPFGQALTELARDAARQYALFAVRPSGFGNFNELAAEFRKRRIEIGYEPVAQDRAVRLSRSKAP